ncbi:MAG: hypothetical protein M3295_00050 [Chloroflexota bacterium]|nr:hypothetical protein [Chloroflexota bacterium]
MDDFGAGDFDGFVIAEAVRVDTGPRGHIASVEIAVLVAYDAAVPPTVTLPVGPHGPRVAFQPGKTYFVTLHRTSDPSLPPLAVHPCGPAFEISSAAELDYLLALEDNKVVVDPARLAGTELALRRSVAAIPLPAYAAAGTLLVLLVGVLFTLATQRRGRRHRT